MKVFDKTTSFILFPIYYFIHHNIIFGYFHKKFIKKFYYKKFKFNLDNLNIPLPNYSSFLFKTYEYNDKKLVEKHINKKNKCIIIGGGLGFIATLSYHLSKSKVLVLEINTDIITNLKENLKLNNCDFELINNNLTLDKISDYENFYLNKDFLATSQYLKTTKIQKIRNITKEEIKNFNDYNTLIIDGEGIEEHFINNLHKIPNIKYLIFEFHHNIFNDEIKNNLFYQLEKNNFKLVSKCFNSYYFINK